MCLNCVARMIPRYRYGMSVEIMLGSCRHKIGKVSELCRDGVGKALYALVADWLELLSVVSESVSK